MGEWRSHYRILVTDAHTVGAVAVIRALGQAGYAVIAASMRPNALGFYSAYCGQSRVQPPYENSVDYLAWLDDILTQDAIQLIIPSEAFLHAIRSRFDSLKHLMPVPSDASQVYRALSKFDLFRTAVEGGLTSHLPPFLLIDSGGELPALASLRAIGAPLFVKVDAIHAHIGTGTGTGTGNAVFKCETPEAALEKLRVLRGQYRKLLVQGFVPGVGVGAFLARWRGDILAQFMHRRLHEVPHWGGASSFRESWNNGPILADAHARLKQLEWDGVGMFEYRWNPANGDFFLMEFNSRFWGSLHLALFAGVNFPCLLADAFFGHLSPAVLDYRPVKSRLTFPGELEYVFSCLKDSALPWPRRIGPIAEFVWLGLDPRIHTDFNFPGDRLLYGRMMIRSIRRFLA